MLKKGGLIDTHSLDKKVLRTEKNLLYTRR